MIEDPTSIRHVPAPPPPWIDEEEPDLRELTSTSELDRAMARLAALAAEKVEIEAQKKATLARVEMRAAALIGKAERGIAFWEELIKGFATAQRQALLGSGKKKSRELLHGVLGWRASKEKLVLAEREGAKKELEAWLERNPRFARVKVEPKMDEIQAAFEKDGVIPPGMEHKPSDDVFYVKPVLPEAGLTVKETP